MKLNPLQALLGLMMVSQIAASQEKPSSVLAPNAAFTTPVGGLERTHATAEIVPSDQFGKALRVQIRSTASETNATQLTLPNGARVEQGDVLLASMWIRGKSKDFKHPARIEFLFERATDPWTKSVTQAISSTGGSEWRHVTVPFQAFESYRPGEAMASFRLALGPQTVELAGIEIKNFAKSRTLEQLVEQSLVANPLGKVGIDVRLKELHQTMKGLGGDFCQARYGSTEGMDTVGRYVLDHLKVAHARVGVPLNNWNPSPGVFRDDLQAHASFLTFVEMTRRHIPTVATVWEGPQWMLGGQPEQSGRVLDPKRYVDCVDSIVKYLVTLRDVYHSTPEYFSFNEPDYGVNFKFSSKTMADFIRLAGPRFHHWGLKTLFLVGDTAGGSSSYDYCRPLLADASIAPYLGPISFHCWDVLSSADDSYAKIAELGHRFHKDVWCLEAGHDSALWQAKSPWGTWENALRTTMAYIRTINLTEASRMDYWTYQDNYPIVDKLKLRPYPVFNMLQEMHEIFAPGAKVATTKTVDGLYAVATVGPKVGRYVVMIANPSGSATAELTGLPAGSKYRCITFRDAATATTSIQSVNRNGHLSVEVPLRTVVIISGQK